MSDIPVAIGDTGALLAYYKTDEADHKACRNAMPQIGHLVIPPFVLAELDYLITRHMGTDAAVRVLGHINDRVAIGRFEVPEVAPHLQAARAVMRGYSDLSIGLTDAMNTVMAREFRTDAIFTIDRRHFRTIRPLTSHSAYRLLPDDL